MQPIKRNTGANPFSYTISALGFFYLHSQHMGPLALCPIRRDEAISVLTKVSCLRTRVTSETRTHTLLDQKHHSLVLSRNTPQLVFL